MSEEPEGSEVPQASGLMGFLFSPQTIEEQPAFWRLKGGKVISEVQPEEQPVLDKFLMCENDDETANSQNGFGTF